MPKLYEGAYTILRETVIYGPFYIEGQTWRADGADGSRLTNFSGVMESPLFPTEQAARAYLSRKPWWRRVWAWLLGRDSK